MRSRSKTNGVHFGVLAILVLAVGCQTTGGYLTLSRKADKQPAVAQAAYQSPASEAGSATRSSETQPTPQEIGELSSELEKARGAEERLGEQDSEKADDKNSSSSIPEPQELVQPETVATPQLLPTPADGAPTLSQVVNSVRNNFPVIQEAAAQRVIASGEALSASGAFDRKLEGFNNIQPLDFFENHWYQWSLERNTLWGGKVGASYKLGRGSFEPWYLERETNDLGEFGISLSAPIGRDRVIDANRAELWRAQLERGRVEPFIRSQVIRSVRDAKVAYWDWVAAAANQAVAEQVLELAIRRTAFLERQVEEGEKAKIDLVDNQRVVLSRSAKLADAQRKLQQTTIKLSLFFRTPDGRPRLIPPEVTPARFPAIDKQIARSIDEDVAIAIAERPELAELSIVRRQINIEMSQARNETRPDIDAGLFLGQDVGNPTASDNKSDFEIEGTLSVSVPLERRKAFGKIRQLRGKLSALQAKTQFAAEKITGDVRIARAALTAAALRVEQTTESVQLANQIVDAEQKLYRAGQSTLFELNVREQQAASAAVEQVAAQFDYFKALAELDAARGFDQAVTP